MLHEIAVAFPELPKAPPPTSPRFPDTNTTSTAEYVAVATKMLSRLTPVDKPRPVANSMMNVIAIPSLALGLPVKFRAKIGPTISTAATNILSAEITRTRCRSWKYWILSGS